ncbi:MAG: RhuM family protein [bacterium]
MIKNNNNLMIRNSTSEFLIFTSQAGQDSIQVRVEDENIWLTQKLIAKLFDVTVPTINEHLGNIFKSAELKEESVIRNFRITADDGKYYDTQHYNLEAIIAIGFKVNSERAIEFRRWATKLDVFLKFNGKEVLENAGKISSEVAKSFAESEFEKYRPKLPVLTNSIYAK